MLGFSVPNSICSQEISCSITINGGINNNASIAAHYSIYPCFVDSTDSFEVFIVKRVHIVNRLFFCYL